MELDYKEECFMFDEFIKYNNFSVKELSSIEKEICSDLSKIKVRKHKNIDINYRKINELFLESIDSLGKDTIDYYKYQLSKLKINRSMIYENGYAEIVGNSRNQEVCVTKRKFKDIDFIAFSHELGHIPTLINGARLDYYEYSEVLPIFFEYLSCLNTYKNMNAKEEFLKMRLDIAKNEALRYEKLNNERCYLNKYHYLYLENLKRDNLKYILSLEYVLNLIDIYDLDKDKIKEIIDFVVVGFSTFKDCEKMLDIDTSKCKKLTNILNK